MLNEKMRQAMIGWLLFMSVLHFLLGLLMTHDSSLPLFNAYHQDVLSHFHFAGNESDALRLHEWWLNLFGATLQFVGVLLFILVMLGKRFRLPNLWLSLVVALLLWAPQDIFISSHINLVKHYWIDGVTLLLLLPPLIVLFLIDRWNENSK